jgi:periplasmic copper chaperone A
LSVTRSRSRAAAAVSVAALAAVATVFVAALPAAAHVTVNPRTAEQGGFGKFSFRVPTEKAEATTKVEVVFPTEHPVPFVSVRQVSGWQVKVDKVKLAKPFESHGTQISEAVSKITWSGGKIEPGYFEEFDVSMGPLPKDTDKMVFKALQTYASGEVVRWIQLAQEGQEEPEHPAPVLALTPAASKDGHGTSSTPVASAEKASASSSTDSSAGENGGADTLARLLGGLGLLAGLAGAAVAFLALRRRTA